MEDATCVVDFCREQSVTRRGLCRFHYHQWVKRRPYTRKRPTSESDRLWSRVQIGHPDGCWEWQGARDRDGYGAIRSHGRAGKAHRLAWELAHERTVPDGQVICHRCDNPSCCNPAHLFMGTVAANNRDRNEKGRTSRGMTSGVNKLTADDVCQIRALYPKVSQNALALLFGVSQSNVQLIVTGATWKHLV